MSQTYTTGPWNCKTPTLSSDLAYIRYATDTNGDTLAKVRTLDDQGEALANARLIAEAPEMHSLLMRFKDFQYAVILRLQQARVGEEANALKSLYHELDAVLERIAGSN